MPITTGMGGLGRIGARRAGPRRLHGRRRDLRLFAAFQLAALVPIVAVGFALDRATVHQKTAETLRDATSRATLLVDTVLQPSYGDTDLTRADPAVVQAEMRTVLTSEAVRKYTLRTKLWDRNGRVVASDDTSIVGRTFPVASDLDEALDGDAEADVTDLSSPENVDEHAFGKAIETYVPVRDARGDVQGAFEMYLPYDALAASVDRSQLVLRTELAVALVVLLVLIDLVAWPVLGRLRRQAEDAERAKLEDGTTGLPNRLGLMAELDRLAAAGEPFVVAVADVHGLGQVNDALGFENGDALLRHLGTVLSGGGRTAARIGGDEFAVVLGDIDELPRLRQDVAEEVEIDGVPISPLLSFGAAFFPAHSTSTRELLAMATAAQVAAEHAAGGVATYDPATDPFDADALRLLAELRRAVAADQLVLHYQPQVRAADGEPVGVEALVRWQHPERGLLAPDAFLPMAEKTGLVTEITRWVLRTAAQQAVTWRRLGATAVVSVNISARDLADPAFAEVAAEAVRAAGARPAWLCLELTETALVHDPDGARRVLEALSDRGFRLSLDDFGKGFTSLSQLRDLPLDELKLDRTFVAGMGENAADAAIVDTVAGLARNLRLTVVAEGVETAEQQDRLRRSGFHVVQGWHTGRPVKPEALTPRLVVPTQKPGAGTPVTGPWVLPAR